MTGGIKAERTTSRQVLASRVHEAMREAHDAAQAAFDAHVVKAPRNADGFLAEPLGFARVTASNLQPTVRNILKEMGELSPAHGGGWNVSNFQDHAVESGLNALHATCRAACQVLNGRLSDFGTFSYETFYD